MSRRRLSEELLPPPQPVAPEWAVREASKARRFLRFQVVMWALFWIAVAFWASVVVRGGK